MSIYACGCQVIPASKSNNNLIYANWQQPCITANNLQHWRLKASIAINSAKFHASAVLIWQQSDKQNYQITILTPFASNDVTIYSHNNYCSLHTNHGTKYGNNLAQLLRNELGWQLPLTALTYWLRGVPATNMPTLAYVRGKHKTIITQTIEPLTQQSMPMSTWQIIITDYITVNNIQLPHKINLLCGDLKIKIVIFNWSDV